MLDVRQKGLIRGLIYPIQFDENPVDGVDRVLKLVVGTQALGAMAEQYARAIEAALQSDERLALLIPQPHPESVIRTYLADVRRSLADYV